MADEQGYLHESAGQNKETVDPEVKRQNDILEEAKDNYTFTKAFENAQRTAEAEELEFEGLDMWGGEAREARGEQEDPVTGQKIPAKPTLSVHLLDQNIQQVVSEARQARLALTVKPKTGLANTKTSNRMKGLVRSIQVESGMLENRLWALERAAKVGRGGYRITADFANDGDFDLDLIGERILDYSTVYWDPYSVKADRSDAEWCIETDWMSERERIRRWRNKPIIAPENAFTSETDEWFASDGVDSGSKNRRVRIVTYYKKVYTRYTLGYHPKFGQGWIGDVPPQRQGDQAMPPEFVEAVTRGEEGTRIREHDVATVMIYVLDGTQILEERPWLGRYIPIVEVIGKEYFVRGKRRWKGVIANAADLIRAINVLISAAVEVAGSMPRVPYIMAEGQDEGYEEMWDDAGVKNFTRLYYKPQDVEGKLAPPPQRQQTEPEIQGLMLLIRMMHEMYHAVTGSVAPQLRAVNPYDRSGKAIEALQRQGAAGTSNYLDNLATISMLYEGKVLIDAIPKYIDRPGRVVMVMGEENDDETAVMIKTPFVLNDDGMPVPVPCQTCGGTGKPKVSLLSGLNPFRATECAACDGTGTASKDAMPEEWDGKPVEFVDFADGEYKVQAAIDRSFQTKQDEALVGMQALATSAPELVPVYADLWVRAMGFSGSGEIADRIKAANPNLEDDDLKGAPPALVARFQGLKMRHQQAMQALEQAQKLLDTDAVKQAGQKEIAMIKAAFTERLEKLKTEGKILQQHGQGTIDAGLEQLRGRIESMQQDAEHKHEIILQLLKERGDKEIERHSVALHDEAARRAAERADLSAAVEAEHGDEIAARAETREEDRSVRSEMREEGRDVRGERREEGRDTRTETRDEGRTVRAETREEGRNVRAETRQEGRDVRSDQRTAQMEREAAERERQAAAKDRKE